ncbi:MAG TPA: hypothetical protein VG847_00920, partial [Chitinophagaceae bacterium]|nr:hypothetical protein [Chitinophagaceae bacterium]
TLIKSPYTISLEGNPIAFTFAITPYRAGVEALKDYKIIARLEVEEEFNSNSFSPIKESLIYPESNGCATITVQNILKSFSSHELPRFDQAIIMPLTEPCKRYRIAYRLLIGTALVDGSVQTSNSFYVLKGGLTYQQWDPKKFFTEKLATDKTFLRFPSPKEFTYPDEYKWLSWISSTDQNSIQTYYVQFGYSDGTTSDLISLQTIQALPWQPLRAAAGYNQLNLASLAEASKTVIWYQLSVQSSRAIAWRAKASSAYCLQADSANTGYQGWTTLEEYYLDDNTAVDPAVTKDNVDTDPDYVAPIINTDACPVTITRTTGWRAQASSAYCVTNDLGNLTGYQAWTTLEEYYTDDNTPVDPAVTKDNVDSDPDYVAPVENTTACALGARFGSPSGGSGDALNYSETDNLLGPAAATVTIKLDSLINSNGGTFKVNGSAMFENDTWNVILDGSGNGSFTIAINGVTHAGSAIAAHFTIISVSSGSVGSPKSYSVSKTFS